MANKMHTIKAKTCKNILLYNNHFRESVLTKFAKCLFFFFANHKQFYAHLYEKGNCLSLKTKYHFHQRANKKVNILCINMKIAARLLKQYNLYKKY
jgi:hypothetical protein